MKAWLKAQLSWQEFLLTRYDGGMIQKLLRSRMASQSPRRHRAHLTWRNPSDRRLLPKKAQRSKKRKKK